MKTNKKNLIYQKYCGYSNYSDTNLSHVIKIDYAID